MGSKKWLVLVLAFVLIMGMTACTGAKTGGSGGADADVPSQSDVASEITFYEHSDGEAIAHAMAAKYMELYPKKKVNVSIIANDDYDDKIKVMLSGGADIDAFWIRGGPQTRQLAATGALYPLDDLLSANGVDMSKYGPIADAFKKDGKTYGLLTSKSCWLLWYNKDLFDAAGVDYPINLTWDEYTKLAASLKTDELWGSVCPDWTMNLGASSVGEYLTDENLTKTKEYAKYLEKWYVTDHSHMSIEEMSGSFDINAVFGEGKTYMMINGDWTFLIFPDYNPQFTWCAAPLPVFEGADPESTVGAASCNSIAANSKKAEAAFDFIKFYCYSDEGASIYTSKSQVPAYPSEKALEIYKQTVTVPGANYVFSAKVGMEQGLHDNYEELNTAFKDELKDALVGGKTIDEAFETYKTRRAEILAK